MFERIMEKRYIHIGTILIVLILCVLLLDFFRSSIVGNFAVQKPESCADSDNGMNPTKKGSLGLLPARQMMEKPQQSNIYTGRAIGHVNSQYTDSCVDSDTLKEFICVGGERESVEINCPTGHYCDSGQCVWEQIKGDMNCDGLVNDDDVAFFEDALNNPEAYEERVPDCDIYNADIECDGTIDYGDINAFVACLNENGCKGCVICGNDEIDAGEECDGNDFGGLSCFDFGLNSGYLTCVDCKISTDNCLFMEQSCGNGNVEQGEDCDCGFDEVCTDAEVDYQTCQSLGFDGGVLGCDLEVCEFDTMACSSGTETCDYYIDNTGVSGSCTDYDPSGSGSCGGGTKTAYNDIQDGMNALQPGEIACVREGTYIPSSSGYRAYSSGLPGQQKTLMKYPFDSGGAIIDGTVNIPDILIIFGHGIDHWTIEGFELKGFSVYAIRSTSLEDYDPNHNLIFKDLVIHTPIDVYSNNAPYSGISFQHAFNSHIENVYIDGGGILASIIAYDTYSGDGKFNMPCNNNVVKNSVLLNSREDGIWMQELNLTNNTFINVTVMGHPDVGFDLAGDTTLIDCVATLNGGGPKEGGAVKLWNGEHKIYGLLAYNNDAGIHGLAANARDDYDVNTNVTISHSTIYESSSGLWLLHDQDAFGGSTIAMDSMITSFPDTTRVPNARAMFARGVHCACMPNCETPSGDCRFLDLGNNIIYRPSDPVIRLHNYTVDQIDFTKADINNRVPALMKIFEVSPTTSAVDPMFTDPENGDFTPLPNSPLINAGSKIGNYHCDYAEDSGSQHLNDYPCKEWYGSAPDIGAIEYIP